MARKACGWVTHCNGTHGMRARWLTATARMVCRCVTHYNGTHGMRARDSLHDMRVRWLMGNGMSYIMQNNTNLSDSPCVPVGVWVIGPKYTCLSGKGWVIGPRYAWLTSNCTEIGVIGCKLRPRSHYPTTAMPWRSTRTTFLLLVTLSLQYSHKTQPNSSTVLVLRTVTNVTTFTSSTVKFYRWQKNFEMWVQCRSDSGTKLDNGLHASCKNAIIATHLNNYISYTIFSCL